MSNSKKILTNIKHLKILRTLNKKKNIGLCHGVFDVVHAGHIKHFEKARENCDILVVSITDDKFVNKGPKQPINSSGLRARVLTALNLVDYVYVNKSLTAEIVIKNLKPNIYFKGKDYLAKDITKNLNKEISILKKNNGKFIITKTEMLSSTKISNNLLLDWKPNIKKFLIQKSKKFNILEIFKAFETIEKEEIIILGEPILDKYTHCEAVGKTTKDPTLSLIKKEQNIYAGGSIALAKIFACFFKKVHFVTFGSKKQIKKFLGAANNIDVHIVSNNDLQIKERITSHGRINKLIQISNYKSLKFNNSTEIKIIKTLKKLNRINNLVIADFGIGLFTENLIKKINNLSKKIFLNVQTNSLNFGLNYFTKYKKFEYLSLDEKEWQLGFGMSDADEKEIIKKIKKINNNKSFTIGSRGSYFVKKKKSFFSPSITDQVVDTTGCGDAFFAVTTSLIISKRIKNFDLIPFIGNVYAGMNSQHIGNSKLIGKTALLKFLKSVCNF